MTTRVLAMLLPDLAEEIARSAETAGRPLAVVCSDHPKGERALSGASRLVAASAEARAAGVLPAQTLAVAKARCSTLRVRCVHPDALRARLELIAELALSFGAFASLDSEPPYGPVVWLDITGCAHLSGTRDLREGERRIAARLTEGVRALGHTPRIAVAGGPRIAAMIAAASDDGAWRWIAPGADGQALGALPVECLPLEPRWLDALRALGLRSVSDVQALPQAALGTRLGAAAKELSMLLAGVDGARFPAFRPAERPAEQIELEHEASSIEALAFVCRALTERIAVRLDARVMSASGLELQLTLDRGVLASDEPHVDHVAVALPAPLASAKDLLSVLRARLDRVVLRAPVRAVRLEVTSMRRREAVATSLFEAAPRAQAALPRLVAELANELGEARVGGLALGDSHDPCKRSVLVPWGKARPVAREGALRESPEPTRMQLVPEPIARSEVKVQRHLARLEHTAWWEAPHASSRDRAPHDHLAGWARDRAVWVRLMGGERAELLGFFD